MTDECSFDYIVVGGGSAGAAVAGRLAEDGTHRVLLIEAGEGDRDEMITAPSQWTRTVGTRFDWGYVSEPEPFMNDRRLPLTRGKVLGGTGSINAMLYVRGVPLDFDEWAAAGNRGWSYRDVLPYFRRAEDNERGANEFHGVGGPLHVADRRSDARFFGLWIEAMVARGHPLISDFNGAGRDGVGYFQLNVNRGRRHSSASGYLAIPDAAGSPTVWESVHVDRLVLDGTRVSGVLIRRGGEEQVIRAEREVVLSAGAYNSPQILQLSGIGPADHLHELGIRVAVDLPVGDGLQDHPGVGVKLHPDTPEAGALSVAAAASNLVEAGGFFRNSEADATPVVEAVLEAPSPGPTGTAALYVEVLKPESVGAVRLRSTDPTAAPAIVHNHFAAANDRRTLVEGLRYNLEVTAADVLPRGVTALQWPRSLSDSDLWDYIREYGQSLFHPTSSCPMGVVVDDELRVLGVQGLRVVDASVMPTVVRGNPNASIVMIAEKGADLILGRKPLDTATTPVEVRT